jgi:hypothetical protein
MHRKRSGSRKKYFSSKAKRDRALGYMATHGELGKKKHSSRRRRRSKKGSSKKNGYFASKASRDAAMKELFGSGAF